MSGKLFRYLGSLILVVLIIGSISVVAQPITAPATITSPGMYELTADARGITDVYGITIESSDVVLDGQGHFLGGDERDKSVGVYVNKYGSSITNVSVKNLKLEDWNSAVGYKYVKGSEGDTNRMSNLDIIGCPTGIHIEYSDVITIVDNMVRDCSKAITIEQNSNKISVDKNILKNNGVGVIVLNTADVNLNENNINSCEVYGVQITDSSRFVMTKNGISDNKYAALQIENSVDSVITDNNFSKTTTGPVLVVGNGVRGAKIYNNYFGSVNNILVDEISSDIVWNTTLEVGVNILGGPYKGGNYWGSAPGLSGFSDEVVDEDGFGIGDKPFEINAYNIDYLPLTNTDKNYPAPTPTPEEPVVAESEEEIIPDTNETQSGVQNNTTINISETEEPAPLPESAQVNTTGEDIPGNLTSTDSDALPPISVQNEYNGDESVFSALNSSIVQVKDENGSIIENETNQNISTVPPSPVKNGYLLFTGLNPGNQVVLVTSAQNEVVLDGVLTPSLSVPVPADLPLYTSWKLLEQNQTIASGTIDRYPAADETVVITTAAVENSSESEILNPVILPLEDLSVLVLTDANESQSVTQGANESATPEGNNTPFLVVPPVLSYLPQTGGADLNSTETVPLVMMNMADGKSIPGYTITAYAGPGGAIFPEGSVEVMEKGNVTFVLTPYDGHQLDYLLIDGSTVGSELEYQFINVTRDHTIIAGFA